MWFFYFYVTPVALILVSALYFRALLSLLFNMPLGFLYPLGERWVEVCGMIYFPSLIPLFVYDISVQSADGTEVSLPWWWIQNDSLYGVIYYSIVCSHIFVSIALWLYCLFNAPPPPLPPPPAGHVEPLDAIAVFRSRLRLADVLKDKVTDCFVDYINAKGEPYYSRSNVEHIADVSCSLIQSLKAHGMLSHGETPIARYLYRRIVGKQFSVPDQVRSTELGDFAPYFSMLKVDYIIPDEIRTQHQQIVASTGHGKTQCIQSMVLDDLKKDASIVVVDSQGVLINKILSHVPLERVLLIDPETCPPALNIFASKQSSEVDIATAVELFEYIFSALDVKLTGQQSLVYRYLSRLLMQIPGATIETMRDILQTGGLEPYESFVKEMNGNAQAFFSDFRKDKAGTLTETKQAVLRRLLMVLESDTLTKMLASPTMSINMDDELARGKIVLINTSKSTLKGGSSLFGRIFIAQIMQAVMARQKGIRKRTYLYIDEFGDYTEDSSVLFNLFEQARKYELGMIICHQYLGQLTPQLARSISANTAIKFAGGVSAEDARVLASQMGAEPDEIQYAPELTFKAWVKGHGTLDWTIEPGRMERTPKHSEEVLEAFRERMRQEYGWRPSVPVCLKPSSSDPADETWD